MAGRTVTRVVAGVWRGRRLTVPRSGVRPTAERVREAVANRVEHITGGLHGLRAADVFAGSGAMGLELLSRGADSAVFVERDRAALAALRRNIAALGAQRADIVARDAFAAARTPPGPPCDIVFADPPYDLGTDRVAQLLAGLIAGGWAAPAALIVVETAARAAGSPWPAGVAALDSRDYGDTRIWYGRVSAGS